LRDFGDGFVAVLLPIYLLALGLGPLQVGIVSTAALLGSALLTLVTGVLGARHDYRRLLLAAAGLTSVPRSLAAAVSPMLAGALFDASSRACPLVICGGLKIAYDLLLLMQFRHLRPPEER
jgi:MFS family permease